MKRALLTLALWLMLAGVAPAASVSLSWVDNSTNESGFGIERKIGTTGTYAEIVKTAANATSALDLNVTAGNTYCYRAYAFNSSGKSAYSNETCVTVPALPAAPSNLTGKLD